MTIPYANLIQTLALSGSQDFELLDLPVGPQPLPAWVKGASVFWWPGYGNAPDLHVKVAPHYDPDMEPIPYVEERSGHYVARFSDGRVRQWFHASPLVDMDVEDKFLGWGEVRDPWGNRERLCTTVRKLVTREVHEGLGGSAVNFDLLLPSGEIRPCRLRGPWHICPPAGVTECTAVLAGKRHAHRPLAITDDLFLRIMARFQPWHRVARVRFGKTSSRLEVVHSTWGMPKSHLPTDHPHRRFDPDTTPLTDTAA